MQSAPVLAPDEQARTIRRVTRELGRLEALAARNRLRRRAFRALRGAAGAGATLGLLLKLKIAGSLAIKLALSALVGVGFAWPMLAAAILVLAGLVISILSLLDGQGGNLHLDGPCDWPCGCERRRARAARLKALIARRRDWLAQGAGPAPIPRGEADGRRRRGA
ncbi:hypothetical protein [Methylobacterium oxalidis]|uniref:Uncharacterized protein n=1 Tax=Methylobacterium oxalidis TaxID=944322 RepID=A0A512J7K6_9HYPH|nr:hypothetical protein [Methylobacterium oxalidis]GEP05910.1 hypothetical protein MOX02_39480 [Methylobacterium oxalidis]GJE32519.1 hypothetical protein LDDCCGHA_2705 [Methylobacterium oxalidis]GLS61677.1 hypothetical protein GCM10007888_00580 [Methylobacterium oxalidis]